MFKTGIVFFAAGLLLSTTVCAEVVDRIVAVINDEIITLSDLNKNFDPYRKRIEASYKNRDIDKVMAEARLSILNKMIDQNLVDQAAKKSGIVIKDDEVMDTMKEILARRKMKMDELLKEIAGGGSTLEAYKKEIRDYLAKMRLARREIKSKVTVSDEEIGEYYLKHREDYEGKEAVRIKQILIFFPVNANKEIKAKLRTNMDMIHKRLKDGEQFEMIAATSSQGPEAAGGGDIGFVERGAILPAVESAAFKLKTDQISDIIESPVGFHIVKVVDRRGAGIKPIESVRAEIRGKLEGEKMDKKQEEWIKELREKAHIEIKL